MSEDILIVYLQILRLDSRTKIQEIPGRRRSVARRGIPAPEISRQYTSNQHFVHFCKPKSVVNNKWWNYLTYSYKSSLSPSLDSSKRRSTAGGGSNGRRSTFAYLPCLSHQWKHKERKYTLTFDQIQPFGVRGARNVWCVQRTGQIQMTSGRQLRAPVRDSTQNDWDQLFGGYGDSLLNPWEKTFAELGQLDGR